MRSTLKAEESLLSAREVTTLATEREREVNVKVDGMDATWCCWLSSGLSGLLFRGTYVVNYPEVTYLIPGTWYKTTAHGRRKFPLGFFMPQSWFFAISGLYDYCCEAVCSVDRRPTLYCCVAVKQQVQKISIHPWGCTISTTPVHTVDRIRKIYSI